MPGLALMLLASGCGDESGGSGEAEAGADPSRPASCEPLGKNVACTGPSGCAGFQVCDANGRYGACDCSEDAGSNGANGAASSGGDGGTGGAMCGIGCTSDDGCGGQLCLQARSVTSDVEGLGTLEVTLLPGGVCSSDCDPKAPVGEQGCGNCGECFYYRTGSGVTTVCEERCVPSATDNGCSRAEYTCDFAAHTCVPGACATDEECRVYQEDSDGDRVADALVYDAMSEARCNLETRRCQAQGRPGAEAGAACVRHDDCEADGHCLTETGGGFPLPFVGGYCIKYGCNVEGIECAGEGVCTAPRAWFADESLGTVCARGCEAGAEPAADQLGTAGHGGGCRPGYMCVVNSLDDRQGTCLPGNYNAVTTNNIGALCDADSDCYSPFGHGRCIVMGSDTANVAVCTIPDCDTPGLPEDLCGDGNTCQFVNNLPICVRSCSDATQCAAGLACIAVEQDRKVCLFGCTEDAECRPGEICASRTGECVASSTAG